MHLNARDIPGTRPKQQSWTRCSSCDTHTLEDRNRDSRLLIEVEGCPCDILSVTSVIFRIEAPESTNVLGWPSTSKLTKHFLACFSFTAARCFFGCPRTCRQRSHLHTTNNMVMLLVRKPTSLPQLGLCDLLMMLLLLTEHPPT